VLLAIGGAALALTLYFVAIIEPMTARETRLRKALALEVELLLWLEQQRPRVGQQAASSAPRARLPEGASLLAVINTSASDSGIAARLTRVTPTAARGASLEFSAVPYAPFTRWLLALDDRYGAVVERIRMERADTAGSVDVEMSLLF
jgi:type II secretory pathway component PulM